MTEKRDKDVNYKVDQVMGDRNVNRQFTKKLISDREFQEGDKLRKKLEFVAGNEALVTKKVAGFEQEMNDKFAEKIDYFPFTHGEAIEI